jgi:hypothetical protein
VVFRFLGVRHTRVSSGEKMPDQASSPSLQMPPNENVLQNAAAQKCGNDSHGVQDGTEDILLALTHRFSSLQKMASLPFKLLLAIGCKKGA